MGDLKPNEPDDLKGIAGDEETPAFEGPREHRRMIGSREHQCLPYRGQDPQKGLIRTFDGHEYYCLPIEEYIGYGKYDSQGRVNPEQFDDR